MFKAYKDLRKEFFSFMEDLDIRFDGIISRLNKLEGNRMKGLVKCDKCKCLLEKQDAFKGESTIEKEEGNRGCGYIGDYLARSLELKEKIVKHYFCQRCKPVDLLTVDPVSCFRCKDCGCEGTYNSDGDFICPRFCQNDLLKVGDLAKK